MKAGIQSSAGRLVGIMLIIVVTGILIARTYYGNLNRSVDPRIRQARELYESYDQIARKGDYFRIEALLDSISAQYSKILHYQESYELGVLHNNRGAALLTIAIYGDSIPETVNPYFQWDKDSIVRMADYNIRKAISIYEDWNMRFQGKGDAEIRQMIEMEFVKGLDEADPDQVNKYLNNRVKEIAGSLVENQRRLSVCYTNLGLVHRLREEYPEAVSRYEKAISLWDRNLEAENNLNRLLGRPLKKRNIIQKLFPPNKELSGKEKI